MICHLFKITRFDVKVQSSILIDFPVKGKEDGVKFVGKSLRKLTKKIVSDNSFKGEF